MLLWKLALVSACCVLVAEAGYKRRAARAEGKEACHDHAEEHKNLTPEQKEKLLNDLIREMGGADDFLQSPTKKVSREERMKLLEECIKQLIQTEEDDSISYSLKIGQFCIMTEEEKAKMTGANFTQFHADHRARQLAYYAKFGKRDEGEPPKSVDNCANSGPVENQEQCGSCWAFAASHTMTGWLKHRDGQDANIIKLSEQQLVDCTYKTSDGCTGGWAEDGWRMMANIKANTDFQVPYSGTYKGLSEKHCNAASNGGLGLNLKTTSQKHYITAHSEKDSWNSYYAQQLPAKDVKAMKHAVAKGGAFIAMNVFVGGWSSIGEGVYSAPASCAEKPLEGKFHAMMVCGYDHDEVTGKDYWMVKNSWGTGWGDKGYIKVEMGKNTCMIESYAQIPILDAKHTDLSTVCVNSKVCSMNSQCGKGSCTSGKCVCPEQAIDNTITTLDNSAGSASPATSDSVSPTTGSASPASPSSESANCADESEHCDIYANEGFCEDDSVYAEYMAGSCAKTCEKC